MGLISLVNFFLTLLELLAVEASDRTGALSEAEEGEFIWFPTTAAASSAVTSIDLSRAGDMLKLETMKKEGTSKKFEPAYASYGS
jgi:hypothetical protein